MINLMFALLVGVAPAAPPTLHARCEKLLVDFDVADFKKYLVTKDEVGTLTEFKELDNRNLAGTFYHLVERPATFPVLGTTDQIKANLLEVFAVPPDRRASMVVGRGVRAILLELLKSYAAKNYVAVLPEDIYPVYGVEAQEAGFDQIAAYRSVPTLGVPETSTARPAVMVITSPLSPSGRALDAGEVRALKTWLAADPARRLILDTVYTFARQWDAPTLELIAHDQVLAVHSFAKAWLLPGFLGFAVGPRADLHDIDVPPDFKLASQALAVAAAQPDLPGQLRDIFEARWRELARILRSIDPGWMPPTNGYLATVPLRASAILRRHGYWTMPLSTFGSPQPDYAVVSALPDAFEDLYYATTLSNLARGYDKYANEYSKAGVPESRFNDRFFLLAPHELDIGISKTKRLLEKLGPDDRIVVVKTGSRRSRLLPNERTGLGRYVMRNHVWLEDLYYLDDTDRLERVRLEDAMADSYALHKHEFVPFADIRPRSISILPIPIHCQAKCKFCFSEASVSSETQREGLAPAVIERALVKSKAAGAERVVITGGGEPTLLAFDKLRAMIEQSAQHFPGKVTMISNGLRLGKLSDEDRLRRMIQLDEAGLSVLAISRHHQDPRINAEIMGVDTLTENVARTYHENRARFKNLKLRFVCVLQKAGVNDEAEVEKYVAWARALGVTEINFKELYVSTDRESDYVNSAENLYSEQNRVYLRTVLNFARWAGWEKVMQLPWGAPVFAGEVDGRRVQIAAYTEPSLFWERTNGVARSWNLMADGKLLVSLETGDSEIPAGE